MGIIDKIKGVFTDATLFEYFGKLDYAFIIFYIVVLLSLGFYLKKQASKSLDNYVCGGGNIPWWCMGISGMASFLDLAGTAVIVSFLFMMGPQGLFIEFRGGAVLILPFMMLWTGKWHRRSGCLTGAQWNIFRFGDCWGGRASQLMGVIATVLTTIGMLAYLIVGAGIFLSTFLPWGPFACSIGLLVLATPYTMMSGFYGVIFTDLFQSLIIISAVIYVSVVAFTGVDSAQEVGNVAMAVTGNTDWISGIPKWEVHVPRGYEVYKHLIIFSGFYLLRTIVAGVGTGADPRYFGAKNDRECGKLSMLWTALMGFRWPLMIGIAVLGLHLVNELIPNLKYENAASLIHQQYPSVEKPKDGPHAPKDSAQFVTTLKDVLGEEKWAELKDVEQGDPKLSELLQGVVGEEEWAELVVLGDNAGTVKWDDLVTTLTTSPAAEDAQLVSNLKGMLGEDVWVEELQNVHYDEVSTLSQAADLIKEQYPDLEKPKWGEMISKLSHDSGESEELLAAVKGFMGEEKWAELKALNEEGKEPVEDGEEDEQGTVAGQVEGIVGNEDWEKLAVLENNTDLIAELEAVLGEDKWVEKMNLISFEGTVNPEKILSQVLMMKVAKGMRGILVIALIAAALSTFGSWVNLGTSQFVNDFYKKWLRPEAKTRELIFASWGTVITIVVLSVWFSTSLESINEIWGWMMMGFGAGFLVPSFLRLYWWRFNGAGSAIGTLVGLSAAIVQRAINPDMVEWQQFVFVMIIGLIGSIVAALLTKPTDEAVLKNMYLKTRPMGVWGHLKKTLSEEERAKTSLEHRNDLVTLPFALVWQVCIFLAPMLFILHNWAECIGATVVGLACFAFIWFFWFKQQPKDNFYEE